MQLKKTRKNVISCLGIEIISVFLSILIWLMFAGFSDRYERYYLEQSIYNAAGNLNLSVGSANELSSEITNGLNSANITFDFDAQNIADSISSIEASAQVNDNVKYKIDYEIDTVKVIFEYLTTYKDVTIYQDIILNIKKDDINRGDSSVPLEAEPATVTEINGLRKLVLYSIGAGIVIIIGIYLPELFAAGALKHIAISSRSV